MRKLTYILLTFIPTFAIGQGIANPNTNHGTNAGNSGSNNTSIGYKAGDIVTGSHNTFLGNVAGAYNTSGTENAFAGSYAGNNNTTGSSNSFFGYNSGTGSPNGVSGSKNSVFGSKAGSGISTGYENSFLGYQSGYNNYSGYCNTFLGTQSGYVNGIGSFNVFLGYKSGYNETGSNKLYIENSSSSLPLIYGDFSTDKVGINALPNTTHTLTVGGTIHATGIYINGQSLSDAGFEFWTKAGNNVWNNTGNVGIGTNLSQNPNNYKLAVKGKIGAQEIHIENNSLTWSDFVFYDDYELMNLLELESYIKKNKHLPEIPTEEEVRKNGLLLGEMNAKLLLKIEELTLHLIELKKEVEVLKTKQNEKK